jgi:hypothetical protein
LYYNLEVYPLALPWMHQHQLLDPIHLFVA